MNKIKLSIIALSCVMALGACSSSSKGGSDNSEQIRQMENELKQKISEANKKAEAAIKAAKTNNQQAEAERQVAEERLKQLQSLQSDEKSRVPLSDKIFGGSNGEMADVISGGIIVGVQNSASRPLARDIGDLTIIDEKGKLVDINILRKVGDVDPWTYEEYEDAYNLLRKEGQTILSNNNLKSSAFGTYVDKLTGNQYFYAQGEPTLIAQIPTAGTVEYQGGAVYKKDGDKNYSELSEMKATADFANKVIDINIKEKPNFVPGMNFGGKITGNSFAGEVNGIKTQGGFFGENVQEMTGLFTNEADQSRGAFGGIKQ